MPCSESVRVALPNLINLAIAGMKRRFLPADDLFLLSIPSDGERSSAAPSASRRLQRLPTVSTSQG